MESGNAQLVGRRIQRPHTSDILAIQRNIGNGTLDSQDRHIGERIGIDKVSLGRCLQARCGGNELRLC